MLVYDVIIIMCFECSSNTVALQLHVALMAIAYIHCNTCYIELHCIHAYTLAIELHCMHVTFGPSPRAGIETAAAARRGPKLYYYYYYY